MLLFQYTDEVATIQVGILSIVEELTVHLSAGSLGRAPEAALRIEKLEFRGLVLVFQPVGTDHQHLAGVVHRFAASVDAMGLVIQPQLQPSLPGQVDKAIQHRRVANHSAFTASKYYLQFYILTLQSRKHNCGVAMCAI